MYTIKLKSVFWLLGIAIFLGAVSSLSQAQTLAIEPYENRPVLENAIIEERLDTLLPGLMRESGIDMWLVIAREYNDDPVFMSHLN